MPQIAVSVRLSLCFRLSVFVSWIVFVSILAALVVCFLAGFAFPVAFLIVFPLGSLVRGGSAYVFFSFSVSCGRVGVWCSCVVPVFFCVYRVRCGWLSFVCLLVFRVELAGGGGGFFSVPCEIMGGLAGVIAAVLVSCLFAVVYRVVDCDGVFPLIV